MTHISRRTLMQSGSVACLGGLLTACTVTTHGSVTSFTLDVAKVEAYAQAGYNFAQMVLAVPNVAQGIGAPLVAVVEACAQNALAALDSLKTQANGSLTVSYNNASVKQAFQSILADFETVLSAAGTLLQAEAGLSQTVRDKMSLAMTAAETITSLMQAMVSTGLRANDVSSRMSESAALAVLGVSG